MADIVYSNIKCEILITGSYALIPKVTKIDPPSAKKDEIEVTSHESTSKEFVPARLSDPGSSTLTYFKQSGSAVHNYIESRSFAAGTSNDVFRLTFADGSKWGFSGSFVDYKMVDGGPNGVLSSEATIRLSGDINRNAV